VTRNDAGAAALALEAAGELFGGDRAVEVPNPSMGGEDFAFFLEKLPGAYVWLGIGEDAPKLHTPTFDFDEAILPKGAALLTALALKSLS